MLTYAFACFRMLTQVLSAKHQHADAMRCVRMATAGRETLMLRLHPHTAALSHSLSNSVSNSAAPAPRTAWVVAEARLEHAKCALAAGKNLSALSLSLARSLSRHVVHRADIRSCKTADEFESCCKCWLLTRCKRRRVGDVSAYNNSLM
jgi:hypothetical protein